MQRRSFLASLLLALFCPWKTVTTAATVSARSEVFCYAPYIPFYTTPTIGLDDFVARKKSQIATPPLMARRAKLHSFAQGQQSAAKRQTRWNGRVYNSRYWRKDMVAYPASAFLLPR